MQCTTHPSSSLYSATTAFSSSLAMSLPRKISLRLDGGILVEDVAMSRSCVAVADVGTEMVMRGELGEDVSERETEIVAPPPLVVLSAIVTDLRWSNYDS
mmetsp:Transcript_11433/g.14144  ORF Transcript_11433/g.14144 Transcript_11433/m.14144 type:complete len:100 (-) Transcript_11433:146-445(-)